MRRGAVLTIVPALLLSACGAIASSPAVTPSQSPEASALADCVNPPSDLTTLIDQSDPLACYGSAVLTVDALVTGGVFDCPGTLEPAWFGCAGLVALNPPPGTSGLPTIRLVATTGEFLTAVIHPDIEDLRQQMIGSVVHLTGHYDDPAAQDCEYTSWPDADPPSPDAVIHQCRSTFVITAMELL